jgi:uncharacterized membrane protein YgcG
MSTYITDAYREKQAMADIEKQELEQQLADLEKASGQNIRRKKFGRFL